MTRTEQAELAELHMTPEQLEERQQAISATLDPGATTVLGSRAQAGKDGTNSTLGPSCPNCPDILHRTGKNRVSDCGHMRWTQKGWAKKEKQRSDAGKPRENFYINVPAIRFDMTADEGEEALCDYLSTTFDTGTDLKIYHDVIEQLLREIDRLRAKQ